MSQYRPVGGNIEKAKLFAALLAEASADLAGLDVRIFGFTDSVLFDAGDSVVTHRVLARVPLPPDPGVRAGPPAGPSS